MFRKQRKLGVWVSTRTVRIPHIKAFIDGVYFIQDAIEPGCHTIIELSIAKEQPSKPEPESSSSDDLMKRSEFMDEIQKKCTPRPTQKLVKLKQNKKQYDKRRTPPLFDVGSRVLHKNERREDRKGGKQ